MRGGSHTCIFRYCPCQRGTSLATRRAFSRRTRSEGCFPAGRGLSVVYLTYYLGLKIGEGGELVMGETYFPLRRCILQVFLDGLLAILH